MSEKKPKRVKARRSHETVFLQRFFGELPVVDAQRELRVLPTEEDYRTAVPNDPRNCVLSRACHRAYGSVAVVFLGGIAYVDLLNKKGERRIERFILPDAVRKMIRDFDEGQPLDPAGFTIRPPAPSQTLDGKAESSRISKERKKEALLKGRSVKSKRKKNPVKAPPKIARVSAFRNGTGMVHFPGGEEQPAT